MYTRETGLVKSYNEWLKPNLKNDGFNFLNGVCANLAIG